MEKLRYQAKTGTIIYRSKLHPVLKRNFEVFSACDWLAALTAHIPNAGEHLVRYYGWYSNVNRGKRRKVQGEEPTVVEDLNEVSTSVAKRAWARLIKQVYEVDPLICPRCAEEIAQQYPSLRLADVYAVIAFYNDIVRGLAVGLVIEDIPLLAERSLEREREGQIRYLPLR